MSTRNPWDQGLLLAGMLLVALGSLFIIGVLVVVALGVQLSETQAPASSWIARAILAVIGVLAFVIGMAARWNRRNATAPR